MIVESLLGTFVAGLLSLWLFLSVAQYHPAFTNWVASHDPLMLIPQWSFFAPIPNRSDYYFYLRFGYDGSDDLTSWTEVMIAAPRRWFAFAWNPDRRIRKGFFDLSSELCRLIHGSRAEILVSQPYIHLAALASDIAAKRGASLVQFAISRTDPDHAEGGIFVLFASELHMSELHMSELHVAEVSEDDAAA